jgi:hypothetical protein
MRRSPDTLSWHARFSWQGRNDRSHFVPLLFVLTWKPHYSPRSDYCANHQGKTNNSKSLPLPSSASGATGNSASPDPRHRLQPRSRGKVSASASVSASGEGPRLARPQPQPQEKSLPRPTSASDRLRYRGYIITLPLASRLRLRRNKTGVTSRLLRQQVMMVPCMRPWRRLFLALYEGKETSAGPRVAPRAALLQGSSTSPPAMLAHSYTPMYSWTISLYL